MRRLILQFAAVCGMGMVGVLLNPSPAAAKAKCTGGLVICTASCPAYPHLLCQAYGCSGEGASCVYQGCSGLDYTVTCHAA